MPASLSHLQSQAAVQAALDEFVRLGRTAFLARYGFGKSRDFLVRDPRTGILCDSKAIVGAAWGHQFPQRGPLRPADFSGGAATVEQKLRSLGFEVVRIGEDWSEQEVAATVASYFEMLRLDAQGAPYRKSAFNEALRLQLRGRSKASVELKYQNVSAVLHALDLPFIPGYKPRGNAQLLLRKAVQKFVLDHADLVKQVVDTLEEATPALAKTFQATVVEPPPLETVAAVPGVGPRLRIPRKIDQAARDDANRTLGHAGEGWVIGFEQQRLRDAGQPELFERLEWVSETRGDGAGYDILSWDSADQARYIEVKTTNGAHASSFIISRNELDFAREAGDAFHLYRVFQFRSAPSLYMLRGDVSRQLHLEAIDYRASFRRLMA